MIPIERLISAPTSDDVYDKLVDVLERIKIPARSWKAGGVARSILAAISEVGAQGASIVSSCVAGGFLSFAKGDYLTAHAKDVYDVDRIEATFASGFATLTNAGGAIHNIAAETLILRSTTTGARFRNTTAFVLNASSSLVIDIRAIESGASQSVQPGEVDDLETPLARVTATNAAAIIGRDAERDEDLVQRCLTKRATWSPLGPRDAYEHAALTARLPDGSATNITRVRVSRYSSTGTVKVTCATPTGTPTTPELDAVRAEVEKVARPDSVTAIVQGAVAKATAHQIVLWARGGNETIIRSRAEDALSTLIAGWPIGGVAKSLGGQGYLYSDTVAAACISSSTEAFDVDFESGTGVDITLDDDEVATNTTTFDVRIM